MGKNSNDYGVQRLLAFQKAVEDATAESLAQANITLGPSRIASELRILASGTLGEALLRIRPALATAAQTALDSWEQDEEGHDEMLGSGGACDQVAEAMAGIIAHQIPQANLTEGGHQGDDHAWLIVYTDQEAFGVDIPPGVYETGSGYNWKKRPGVKLTANDVEIFRLNRADIDDEG